MATAAEFTKILTESGKTIKAMDYIRDFVDVVNKHQDDLDPGAKEAGEKIREVADTIQTEIQTITGFIDEALNKMEVDPEECEKGSKNLLLYYNTLEQAMVNVSQQINNYEENSYWWRYWSLIMKHLQEMKGYP